MDVTKMTARKNIRNLAALLAIALISLTACSSETEHDEQSNHDVTSNHSNAEINSHEDAHGHDDEAEHSDSEIRQTDSHVHGDAVLAMALDGEVLVIELESPLYNLLGFEHAPETEEQTEHLSRAEITLGQPANLFSFNAEAGCTADNPAQNPSLMGSSKNSSQPNVHKDALIEYSFRCDAPDRLKIMTTNLFTYFPKLTELDVIYLGPSVKLSTELEPFKDTMKLTK